jgi:hypothetical protein
MTAIRVNAYRWVPPFVQVERDHNFDNREYCSH